MPRAHRQTCFFLLVLLVWTTGCSSSSRLRYEGPQEAYEKGLAEYEEGDYEKAIGYLRGAFDFGRTHQWAADTQLLLARAYRENEEFLLAANEYTRFSQIYRSDPRVPQAEYELAMTYYDRSPAVALDQTPTQQAISQFRLFIIKYREHPLVEDAQSRIVELREKLALKKVRAAQQYETREYWEAAAITYESVFDEFYDTTLADDALVGAIRAYNEYAQMSIQARKQERFQKAVANYERLIQIFPQSDLLKEAEAEYLDVQSRLDSLTGTTGT